MKRLTTLTGKNLPKLSVAKPGWPVTYTTPVFVGVDYGHGKDWTVEVEFMKNPDGSFTIMDERSYRTTIECEAIRTEDRA